MASSLTHAVSEALDMDRIRLSRHSLGPRREDRGNPPRCSPAGVWRRCCGELRLPGWSGERGEYKAGIPVIREPVTQNNSYSKHHSCTMKVTL